MIEDYSDIRAFNDDDISSSLKELMKEPTFNRMINSAFPNAKFEDMLKNLNTIEDIQYRFVLGYMEEMLHTKSDGFSYSGLENLKEDEAHLYISNHRDIILDSALLNYIHLKNNLKSTEIAIGDNLLIFPWIKTLVRLNKSFIVKRKLPVKQMMVESLKLSRYIQHTLLEKKNSIWIAQREGRAKDSNDRTSKALLKMLCMGNEEPFTKTMSAINITPLSIAYEYDPCDYLKAREFLLKKLDPDFKKSPEDDLLNMRTGIEGYKGRIHFHIAPAINEQINKLSELKTKNEQVDATAELIDQQIHLNYKFFPCNFISHEILHPESDFSMYYDVKYKAIFEQYLQKQIDRIPEKEGNEEFLRNMMLTMYANPLINHIIAHSELKKHL